MTAPATPTLQRQEQQTLPDDPTAAQSAVALTPPSPKPREMKPWQFASRLLMVSAFALICLVALDKGLTLRRWVWDVTDPIRFGDIKNGCRWGLLSSGEEGYLNQYEKMAIEDPTNRMSVGGGIWLDYAPLRLLVMAEWGKWLRKHYPEVDEYPPAAYPTAWQRPYEFNAPVLKFNTAMDLLAAICAFFLTRLWIIRSDQPMAAQRWPRWLRRRRGKDATALDPHHNSLAIAAGKPSRPFFRGCWQGLAAALLVWFNPGMLVSAYGWPTWDAWIVPLYLLGALLASLEWWLAAGVAIAIGAMFKGQQLAVAPVFILWPLMQGKIGAVLRWCAGLALGLGVIASPWLLTYIPPDQLEAARAVQATTPIWTYPPDLFAMQRILDQPALYWVVAVILAAALLPLVARMGPAVLKFLTRSSHSHAIEKSSRAYSRGLLATDLAFRIICGLVAGAIVFYPWIEAKNYDEWITRGLPAALALGLAVALVRLRYHTAVVAAAAGASLLLCMDLFHGSSGWWLCGFHFGTIHWPWMVMGQTSNFPGILEFRYGWPQNVNLLAFTLPAIPWHWPAFVAAHQWWPAVDMDVTTKQMCTTIYVFTLLLCGIGMGLQARRNDRRMLVALAAPWLMFFCFPGQIHERYLLYAGGVAAICIGQSIGMTLMGIFLSLVTVIMTLHVMLISGDVSAFGKILNKQFPWLCTPQSGHTLLKYIKGTHPDIAWAVLTCAAVFLYITLTPSPGRKRIRNLK